MRFIFLYNGYHVYMIAAKVKMKFQKAPRERSNTLLNRSPENRKQTHGMSKMSDDMNSPFLLRAVMNEKNIIIKGQRENINIQNSPLWLYFISFCPDPILLKSM